MNTTLSSLASSLQALSPVLPAIADAALKGAVIILVAALVAHLLRDRSAAARHLVWSAALVAQIALPVFGALLPEWRVSLVPVPAWLETAMRAPASAGTGGGGNVPAPVAPQRIDAGGVERLAEKGEHAAIVDAGGDPAPAVAELKSPSVSSPAAASRAPAVSAPRTGVDVPWLTVLWIAGALTVLLRLAVGTVSVARLARAGNRIEDGAWLSLTQRLANRMGIERPLTLLRGERLGVPVTWGIVYPVVLLPAEADQWPEERRQFVLVHEMAHVKRFDALTQLVAQATLAVFWFNPLVWLAVRRMRAEREHACDDYVLREGTKPSLYADELLGMVRSLGTTRHDAAAPAFAALAMARRSEFEGRMLAILDPRADRHTLGNRSLAAVTAVVALLVLPLAAMRPFAQPPVAAAAATVPTDTVVRSDTVTAPDTPMANAAKSGAPASMFGPSIGVTTLSRSCTTASLTRSGDTRSISHHTDDDGSTSFEYFEVTGGRCVHASSNGDLRFTDDDSDIANLAPGQAVYIRERTDTFDREITLTRSGSTIVRRYEENGRDANWEPGGRTWLAGLLPKIIRESGFGAKERAARIRARGGVGAVLQEISLMRSTGAKRSYFEAMLAQGSLSDAELDRVVRQAGSELSRSSGDLSAVLKKIPTNRVAPAVGVAVENVRSDGDRRSVLTSYMQQSGDRELMLTVLRATASMISDGDKSAVLVRAAPSSMLATDDSLRAAYFRATRGIVSNGDKSRVLLAALESGGSSDAVVREVVKAVRAMTSDGDRRRVLLGAIRSSGARPTAAQEIIAATKSMTSSGDKAAVLIEVANRKLLTTAEARDEFVSAARAITSDGDFRRVMDALLRAPTDTIKQ